MHSGDRRAASAYQGSNSNHLSEVNLFQYYIIRFLPVVDCFCGQQLKKISCDACCLSASIAGYMRHKMEVELNVCLNRWPNSVPYSR